uniref:Olfactory receptor 81 n=1 Tax=Aulacocentrum confusum TaxID=2767324 RepID=A0A7G8Z9A0_9HYME|nr:olfactory receptor 81 [Aulacocentrum confusum]
MYKDFIYAVTVLYLSTPLVPKVLDYLCPLNTSRPTMFPYQVEYFLDSKVYEVPIFIHAFLITPFPSTIIVAFDSLYANCVQHACSMFTIVGLRLKNISYHGEYMIDVKSREEAEEKMYRILKNCIKKHQDVLRFSRLLEICYSQCLMVIVGINMAALSITGLQTVIKINELSEALRFGTYTIGQVVHLYFLSFPGQKLLDHSVEISHSVYQGQWYKIPPKSRRLFILVIMRSREPCKLTAGKMYTMSSRSFARVVKKSMSYFTVFNSMQ